MNDITYAVNVDVNNPIISYNVYVASVLDSNVRYLEITLYQNGNVIALSNTATATASLVADNVLVNDSVNCTISDNIITVPLGDLQRHGNLSVQVTVTEDTKVLAIPFPIQVRVTPNIVENAQISEASQGTIPELLARVNEELARVSGCVDDGRVYEIIDAILSDETSNTPALLLDNGNQAGDYILYYVDSEETRHELFNFSQYFYTKARVDAKLANKADTSDLASGLAQKANADHTHSQYLTAHQDISGKEDASNKTSRTNLSADADDDRTKYPSVYLLKGTYRLLNGRIPTKTSDLQNDSGYLTAHQDISGKADKLSLGNDNELVDAASDGTMKRSGYRVTTNKNIITDADSANGFVPDARAVAKAINDAKALIPSAVDGKSAYEIAIEHGYDGTEEEWLEYLVGIKRAYISAQDGNLYVVKPGRYYRDDDGNPGSEPDVHLRLGRVVGADGQNGSGYSDAEIDSNGDLIIKEIRGDGAYGFVNLGHVVGAAGAKGDKGDKGDTGATGAAGADWVPTEQELDGIADRVIAKLPTTQGVLYGD